MRKFINKRRHRLVSEAGALQGYRFRVTKQRGKIVGIEVWSPPNLRGEYPYFVIQEAEAPPE